MDDVDFFCVIADTEKLVLVQKRLLFLAESIDNAPHATGWTRGKRRIGLPRTVIASLVKREFAPTHVGRGVTVGANATIVCGHDLGEYALIGAGSVVTKDVPAHAVVVGNPARRTAWA